MKLTGVGPMAGLAYVNPYMEVYKMKMDRERMDMEREKQAYAINKDLAEMFEVGVVHNKYDHNKQTEFANERIKYIGDYIRKNPDFKTDPSKYMHVKALARELRDNKWTRRSENFQEQAKMYYEAVQKNPLLLATPAYQEIAIKLGNRKETGSIHGDDSEAEFNFEPPFPWDDKPEETIMKIGQGIKKQFKMMPELGYNGYAELPDENEIEKVTGAILTGIQGQQYRAMWGEDAPDMIRKLLHSGSKPEYKQGVYDTPADWARIRASQSSSEDESFDYWGNQYLPYLKKPGAVLTVPPPFTDDLLGKAGDVSVMGKNGRVHSSFTSNSIIHGKEMFQVHNEDGTPAIGIRASAYLPQSEAVAKGYLTKEALEHEDLENGKDYVNPDFANSNGMLGADVTRVRVGKEIMAKVTGVRKVQYGDMGFVTQFNQRHSKLGKAPNNYAYDHAVYGSYIPKDKVDPEKTDYILGDGTKLKYIDGINWLHPDGSTVQATRKNSKGQSVDAMKRNGKWYSRITGEPLE